MSKFLNERVAGSPWSTGVGLLVILLTIWLYLQPVPTEDRDTKVFIITGLLALGTGLIIKKDKPRKPRKPRTL